MSDDEEDVYSFDQRDDETWTPKIKIKINEVKPQRPTRNRKQNSAVAKYLKAAARKRADPAPIILESSSSSLLPPCYPPISSECVVESSPSTFSSFSSPSTSESLSSPQVPARRGRKAKPKPSPKGHKLHLRTDFKGSRLIPPKTCKLLQTSRSAVVAALQPGAPAKQQRVKADGNHTPSTSSPSNAEKKVPSSHITKRECLILLFPGILVSLYFIVKKIIVKFFLYSNSIFLLGGKPKKGMATAKQRLGKILKMHKMFY